MRAAQGGSSEALEALFKLHWPAAFRSAYYIVHDAAAAEDIAQEAFLAAVRALDRFDGRRPFAPWINRIVVNRAIDFARARALRREVGAELADRAEAPSHAPEISDQLLGALAELGARAARGGGAALPARLDARRDRAHARDPPRHRELAPSPSARSPGGCAGGRGMTERELRRALRERPVPGEREAAERTLRVLRAAHAEAAPVPARRRRLLRPALALALALTALGTVLSPAGADVRRWIGDRLDPEPSTLSRLARRGALARELRRRQLGGERRRLAAAPGRLLERRTGRRAASSW